jgi:hypothetical protein
MRVMRFAVVIGVVVAGWLAGVVVGAELRAQAVPTPAEPSAVMKKLGAMAGEWRGTSWFNLPGGRRNVDSWEKVESKLGGLVLFVHGRHTSLEKSDSGRVVHEAVGILFYDAAAQQLKFVPVIFDGRTVETYVKESDKGMEWGFAFPGGAGQVRYSVDLSQPDVWIETGEFSRDGKTWLPTMQLNLKRVR